MRRKDCAIEDTEQILHIVEACDVIRLGPVDEGGTAYIVPVNFGIAAQEGKCRFYFYSALERKKLALMQAGPQISFEMDTAHSLQASENVAKHTYHYACVMGHGTVRFVEDPAERRPGCST